MLRDTFVIFWAKLTWKMISPKMPFGEKHLRLAIREYMEHYHSERNHQGLDSRIIFADDKVGRSIGDIKTRTRLGGYLNYYYRDVA